MIEIRDIAGQPIEVGMTVTDERGLVFVMEETEDSYLRSAVFRATPYGRGHKRAAGYVYLKPECVAVIKHPKAQAENRLFYLDTWRRCRAAGMREQLRDRQRRVSRLLHDQGLRQEPTDAT